MYWWQHLAKMSEFERRCAHTHRRIPCVCPQKCLGPGRQELSPSVVVDTPHKQEWTKREFLGGVDGRDSKISLWW
jgi:hypothetical protein